MKAELCEKIIEVRWMSYGVIAVVLFFDLWIYSAKWKKF